MDPGSENTMPRTPLTSAAAVAFLVLILLAAAPAAQGPASAVRWSVVLEPKAETRAPGEKLTALVTATIEEGWHVYSTDELKDGPRPLAIDLAAGGPVEKACAMVSPEPERDFDEAFAQVTAYYKDKAVFRVPLVVATTAKPGKAAVSFEVAFQACDGKMCLPGRVVRVSAPVVVR